MPARAPSAAGTAGQRGPVGGRVSALGQGFAAAWQWFAALGQRFAPLGQGFAAAWQWFAALWEGFSALG
jgi:hypothetical protein